MIADRLAAIVELAGAEIAVVKTRKKAHATRKIPRDRAMIKRADNSDIAKELIWGRAK